MTDKEIIIDGIDVSEWPDEEVRYKFEKHSPKAIRQIAFDLYKQLKRKEQECEELKEDRERWKSNFNGKVSAIEELLQQLDQLKAKNIKISKTLTKIKEIAGKQVKRAPDGETFARPEIKQILQKISEVENK